MIVEDLHGLATNALKMIARNGQMKQYIKNTDPLYSVLLGAAQRFVAGETREAAVSQALDLHTKGYSVSIECIGENFSTERKCIEAKDEFIQLIQTSGKAGLDTTVSLDLSHIGLTVSEELAYQHLIELAREAAHFGINIMIGAEESSKTNMIHAIYKRVHERYTNVGITIQAYLHRTELDLAELKHYGGRIRMVKGAYQEPEEQALPRSEQLREKYIQMMGFLISEGRSISIATHDELVIEELRQRRYLKQSNVELEMLYGIRPELAIKNKNDGYRTRVYVTYGTEWHLYFFHRLAEYPPNVYQALADMVTPSAKAELY
ncbi:proline dehydrogenase family protein [Paenibacillus pini]|uniref:proline dehydrogenase n=1 Tax=Paenibacillus pini JCM 16418 TaxID=1236976 RepID=W7Z1X5_9BACL|nr:proline dehydrogenase family protein [Paenibacillus pini]GAF08404.1 proline dehydrogenase [Paenibacillus pini JCM 16418]